MATALTLAQIRDAVRRHLQIIPPIDSGTGNVGDQPPGQPDPNNATVNQAINRAIGAVNRVVRVGKISTLPGLSVAAAPVYQMGPYYVDFSSLVADPLDTAEVADVTWYDGANYYRLEPYIYYADARRFMQFQQYKPAAHPIQYFMMGNQLGLLPAPLAGGTLYITQMEGLTQLVNDTDTISFLPVAYHDVVEYLSVAILSARAAQDVEANERFQKFWMLAVCGLQQIYDWKNGYGQASIQAIKDTLAMIPGMEQALKSALQTAPNPNNQTATGKEI